MMTGFGERRSAMCGLCAATEPVSWMRPVPPWILLRCEWSRLVRLRGECPRWSVSPGSTVPTQKG